MTSLYPVTVYTDLNYRGSEYNIPYGSYGWIEDLGIPNDSISSMKVAAGTTVTIYDNAWFGTSSPSMVIVGPKEFPTLNTVAASGGGDWEDRISSLTVVKNVLSNDALINCCMGSDQTPSCGTYVPGSSACNNEMSKICTGKNLSGLVTGTANMSLPACKQWCKSQSGTCDEAAVAYCLANPTDPFCSCLSSKALTKNIVNPKCVDAACISTGYLTSNMKSTSCPSVIDCSIQADLRNSGVTLVSTATIDQNCGTSTNPGTGTVTAPTSGNNNVSDSPDLFILIMVLLFLFVCIMGLVAYYLSTSSKPKTRSN